MIRLPRHRRRRSRRHRLSAGLASVVLTIGLAAATGHVAPATVPVGAASATSSTGLDGFLAGQDGHAAVAVLDRVTGAHLVTNGDRSFDTASVVKVDVLAALLLVRQVSGTTPMGEEDALATAMITRSDNDATSALWQRIGGADGLAAANRTLGLTETTPDVNGFWGLTTTTAADQLRLLQAVSDPAGPLQPAARGYLFGLMRRVQADQAWGVTEAAADSATGVYVKNGWLPLTADGGLWTVNSIGRIVEPGHDWLVVVLSDHHVTQSAGITTVGHAAGLAVSGLRQA